ncbi:hypothetical protein [Parabacteroides sp.]
MAEAKTRAFSIICQLKQTAKKPAIAKEPNDNINDLITNSDETTITLHSTPPAARGLPDRLPSSLPPPAHPLDGAGARHAAGRHRGQPLRGRREQP